MKKTISLLLTIVMVMSIFSGCAATSSKITKVADLENKTLGTITWFGVSDDALLDLFSKNFNMKFKDMMSYDSEASLIMALDSGKIDAAWLRNFQADVYSKDSDKYSMFASEIDNEITGSARMAAAIDTVAAGDLVKINDALAQMKDDGTLDALEKEYIDNFSFSENYESISMPENIGAPTYKVSISGSMVPLDFIAADGNPTGYSIALLSKISSIAKLNFELVTVGFGTDRLELTSDKIDYIFCYTLTDENMKKDKELIFSDPYYSYSGSAFLVKK